MICILGSSHAPRIFREAAAALEIEQGELRKADLVIIAEDTPTDADGRRDVGPIREIVGHARRASAAPIVLTSQVPVGFTRSLGLVRIWHQAETLRIKDALERALKPEQIILGGPSGMLPYAMTYYFGKSRAPVIRMTWEEAEMAKIAINNMLIAQVNMANKLKSAAERHGASWGNVRRALQYDKRIGPHAYLDAGNWKDSRHLLRDYVTLESM